MLKRSHLAEVYKKKVTCWSTNSITDEIAESIGVGVYLIGCRKALERMLHNLQIALVGLQDLSVSAAVIKLQCIILVLKRLFL